MTRISKILEDLGFKKRNPMHIKIPDGVIMRFNEDSTVDVVVTKGEPCSPTCQCHHTHPCEKCGQQW